MNHANPKTTEGNHWNDYDMLSPLECIRHQERKEYVPTYKYVDKLEVLDPFLLNVWIIPK